MDKNQALKLALEALEEPSEHVAKHRRLEAITAIREALAQPEQELVCVCGAVWEGQELVLTPPQRKPLSVDKDGFYWLSENECIHVDLIRKIEAAHGIKGE